MTIEEKAKAYDEALETARKIYNKDFTPYCKDALEDIFPELKESEDERIRKALIRFHKRTIDINGIKGEDIIAWLEKKGEQKLADTVEPTFHEGDFIKHNKANVIYKVISVNSGSYYVENVETNGRIELFNAEQNFHLWTIQDAKDGDVLATENFIFIFKNIDDDNGVHYYCQYEINKNEDEQFEFDIALPHSLMGRVGNSISHYSPATKEQRDLLFEKMKEADYVWDAEKERIE